MNVLMPQIEMSPRTRRFLRELADEDWKESLSLGRGDARTQLLKLKLIDVLRAIVQARMTLERIV